MNGVFITGTDTGVGKTTIAAALARVLYKKGIDVGVMKPFATSDCRFSANYRSKDVAILAEAANVNEPDEEINPFFYTVPSAPFLASKFLNAPEVNIDTASRFFQRLSVKHEFMIVEGIGGILVPLTKNEKVADFAKLLNIPVIIVSSSNVGTINHTLLTTAACTMYNLDVIGIVINELSPKLDSGQGLLKRTIEETSGIRVLCNMPFVDNDTIDYHSALIDQRMNIEGLLKLSR